MSTDQEQIPGWWYGFKESCHCLWEKLKAWWRGDNYHPSDYE